VTTFARWLTEQSGRAQQDPIGWLSRAWGSLDPDLRARISSPTKIKERLAEHGSQTAEWQGYLATAVDAAISEYRKRGLDTAQQLPPVTDEPAAAELAGEGTMTAEPGEPGISWSTGPQERLGTCLQCGALMGVSVTGSGAKILMCAAGHPIGPKAAQQLIAAADAQEAPATAFDAAIERGDEHLPAPSDPEKPPVTFGHKADCPSRNGGRCTCDDAPEPHPADSELTIFDRLTEVEAGLEAQETMLGLLAQMLAAASPAAAQVMAEFVQAGGDPEAAHAMGAVTEADFEPDPRWQRLPGQDMPPSFQAYYGMAPGRPGEPGG
jgi:hypothetical protein